MLHMSRGMALLFCLCCLLSVVDIVSPLVIGLSNYDTSMEVTLLRRDVVLPEWHQERSVEAVGSAGAEDEDEGESGSHALVIDTLGAFVDTIFIAINNVRTEEVYVMVYDGDMIVWSGTVRFSQSPTTQSQEQRVDLSDAIRAPASDKVKVIETFTFNGDYVTLWRVKYLFDFVDEFIIAEAAFTHSGKEKSKFLFQDPDNLAAFAPYLSKITFVAVKHCPPPPSQWSDHMLGHMARWDEENEGFWRENYQKLFCRFFIRPPSKFGKKTLIFVSDADEIMNVETLSRLVQDEEELSVNDSRSVFAGNNVVHPRMFMFYYNFDTVSVNAWELPYLVSSERYEELNDTLYIRVVGGEEAVYISDGGWHLSYFTSYPGIQKKLNNIAHLTINQEIPCDFIRESIANSLDLFRRDGIVTLAARSSLSGAPDSLLPPWWEDLQQSVLDMQSVSCSCCGDLQRE